MKKIALLLFIITGSYARAQVTNVENLISVHKASTSEMLAITGMDSGMIVFNTDSGMIMNYTGTEWRKASYLKINSVKYQNDSLTIKQGEFIYKVEIINRTPQNLNISGPNTNWDIDKGCNANLTLNQANTNIIINNVKVGQYGTLVVKQDATGGRAISLPTGSKVINGGNGFIPLTSTPNAINILSFYYDGTNYFWTYGNNFD